jgi:hypothetical protein
LVLESRDYPLLGYIRDADFSSCAALSCGPELLNLKEKPI